jgi:hypothetical protein
MAIVFVFMFWATIVTFLLLISHPFELVGVLTKLSPRRFDPD